MLESARYSDFKETEIIRLLMSSRRNNRWLLCEALVK